MPHRARSKPGTAGHTISVSTHTAAPMLPESAPAPRRNKQFSRGWEAGYRQGLRLGQEAFTRRFEGASIIIPTSNSRESLMSCIDSIEANTSMPYEIIVVDHASTDGTASALRRRGGNIRIGTHSADRGFAGAVNTGLMMAKGHQIVWLDANMRVTGNWLHNMVQCLESRPDIGAVAPVMHPMEGPQGMEASYRTLSDMGSLAAETDSQRWVPADRLASSCVLIKREMLEKTGYLAEGCGRNAGWEDWMMRLRHLGRVMVIAGDTFIYQAGAPAGGASGLGADDAVSEEDRSLLQAKWGDFHKRLQASDYGGGMLNLDQKSADFVPAHILVSVIEGRVYWLEEGVKRPVINYTPYMEGIPAPVRVSMLEIRQLALGRPIRAEELRLRLSTGKLQAEGHEGALFRLPDGRLIQVRHNTCREFITPYAAESWGLAGRFQDEAPEEIQNLQEGLPILPRNGLSSDYL
ncbi:glycosyltransferase [Paenibacillus sp. YPG26]|uniref:glycosyltransferase family 2 protein n=1 Tax=Paenibacillus sp. YPG26 TaxID=2878915 RepID=UPI0020418534|nr:glycosyltransferase [Paenibacillus sp. YPG26]USB32490.1 glycosyltransferase [Paenibacillus sp. YPG26]